MTINNNSKNFALDEGLVWESKQIITFQIFFLNTKNLLRIYQVVRGYFYCSKNIKIKELIIWTLNYTLSQVSAPTTFYSVSRSLWIHLCPNYIHSLEWKNPDYLFWTATSGFNIQPKIGSLGLLEIWITNNIRYPGPNYIVKKLCKVSRELPNVEKMQTYPDFESLCLCFFYDVCFRLCEILRI